METLMQHTSTVERTFAGTSFFPKSEPLTASQKTEATGEGKTIAYFLWVYVAIFSFIMVTVMVAERYFIQ